MPRRHKTKIEVGDVYEIETPSGLAYVQYTHDNPGVGQLVRVLPGLYSARPEVRKLTQQRELYFVHYLLEHALRQSQVQIVSREPVPEWAKPFPTMRHEGVWDNSWYIGEGSKALYPQEMSKMLKVKDLAPEQRRLSISSLLRPHPAMVKALARGWTPERAEEFARIDEAERKAREEAAAKEIGKSKLESKAECLDHYLYFPKKSDAEKAAQRLRTKGWTAAVRKGQDGRNWLALAKQPAPIDGDMEEVRDELEQLADEFGGEYDGWGTTVNDEPNIQ